MWALVALAWKTHLSFKLTPKSPKNNMDIKTIGSDLPGEPHLQHQQSYKPSVNLKPKKWSCQAGLHGQSRNLRCMVKHTASLDSFLIASRGLGRNDHPATHRRLQFLVKDLSWFGDMNNPSTATLLPSLSFHTTLTASKTWLYRCRCLGPSYYLQPLIRRSFISMICRNSRKT